MSESGTSRAFHKCGEDLGDVDAIDTKDRDALKGKRCDGCGEIVLEVEIRHSTGPQKYNPGR
jgi:hypothetical protein